MIDTVLMTFGKYLLMYAFLKVNEQNDEMLLSLIYNCKERKQLT